MNADDVRAVIRSTLAELVTPAPRRALVLFTGALIGFEKTIPELAMLIGEGVHLEFVQTPSAERILDQDLIGALGMTVATRQLTGSHDMLIVPTLTQNIAAKTAHGVADCLGSNLMNDYLLAGKPVVVSSSACDPDDPDKQRWFGAIPEGYAQMMRDNLCTLRGFGVRTARAGALARTVLAAYERIDHARISPITTALRMSRHELLRRLGACPAPAAAPAAPAGSAPTPAPAPAARAVAVQQQLISQRVVQRLPEGTVLRVPATAKITAMAADIAGARSITIVREA
ncbi:Flavoprotein [Propionibacterium ruminifibrarum]|uniref:Flavoprotein n=1 Tax=Propionibacterium ruminifibrarum TaxID=1962131 RepID=A0A375HYB4_9ACTN|nr:flavoprotein [Propionibacterium ruminifibrarum]SPF67491.1 Flavoprotein [Propionibacterium ruminifibrarum]